MSALRRGAARDPQGLRGVNPKFSGGERAPCCPLPVVAASTSQMQKKPPRVNVTAPAASISAKVKTWILDTVAPATGFRAPGAAGQSLGLLRPRLKDHIERRLGRPAYPGETAALDHFAEFLFARLCTERRTDLLRP